MPFRIQRVPRGLADLLSVFGGESPTELEDRARLTLDSLQMYGTTQLQGAFANNAALAVGGAGLSLTLSALNWTVLFAANGAILRTATVTSLRARVTVTRLTNPGSILVASSELGPYGATVAGTVTVGGMLPYPLLCPPGSIVNVTLESLGTDATANVSAFAEFGIIG